MPRHYAVFFFLSVFMRDTGNSCTSRTAIKVQMVCFWLDTWKQQRCSNQLQIRFETTPERLGRFEGLIYEGVDNGVFVFILFVCTHSNVIESKRTRPFSAETLIASSSSGIMKPP